MHQNESVDTFEIFKNAFSYGERSDLTFKFLKSFTADEAADFLQELMRLSGDLLTDGNMQPIHDHIYKGQKKAYSKVTNYIYDDGPFTPMMKPLTESRLALITSSGHFVAGDDPKPFGIEDMDQAEAEARIMDFLRVEPQLSAVPLRTPPESLRVRHGGYDIRYAQADNEVNFPIHTISEIAGEGVVGELHDTAYSFVGACSQKRLLNRTGPKWLIRLKEINVDAVLLVPV